MINLEKQVNKKPIIKLTPLERTVIHTPSQKEFDELMQIFELGGWSWDVSQNLPTSKNAWEKYKEKTSVDAGSCMDVSVYKRISNKNGKFRYGDLEPHYPNKSKTIILPQEFYDREKITQETRKETNEYFERVKPDRESKGGNN